MAHYPESEYSFREPIKHDDGTCEIWCDLTIKQGDKAFTRSMWLPCMDHKNKAIPNPDMRKISDTRMRCLTKCISMFGLGHYIYAGEDLPQVEAEKGYSPEQKAQYDSVIDKLDDLGLFVLRAEIGDEVYQALFNSFEKGDKTKNKEIVRGMEKSAHQKIDSLAFEFGACIDNGDESGINEFSDLQTVVKKAIHAKLSNEQQHKLTEIKKAAA